MNPDPASILVVEDDPNDALFIERALDGYERLHSVAIVPDGEAAMAYLAGNSVRADAEREALPVVILTDLKMPRMDGFDLLRWLRTEPRLNGVPVVVFTSSTSERDVAEAFRLGARGYMVKPVHFEELEQTVRSVVEYWRRSLVPKTHPPRSTKL